MTESNDAVIFAVEIAVIVAVAFAICAWIYLSRQKFWIYSNEVKTGNFKIVKVMDVTLTVYGMKIVQDVAGLGAGTYQSWWSMI